MSDAAATALTETEIEERVNLRRQWGLDRPRPSADVIPMARRQPLGLAPAPENDEPPERDADANYRSTLWDEHSAGGTRCVSRPLLRVHPERRPHRARRRNHQQRRHRNQQIDRRRMRASSTDREPRGDARRNEGRADRSSRGSRSAGLVQEAARSLSRGERGEQGPRGVPG